MKRATLALSLSILIALFSCEKQEEVISTDPDLQLSFSSDTVSFDTLFTEKESITRRLRVYNRNDEALRISELGLLRTNSEFHLIVNGSEGTSFNDIVINGKDSIQVLVEVFIEDMDADLPFLIEDDISFITNGNDQRVKLIAFGQDAIRFGNEVIPCNTNWTADRPYLLMDTLLVDSLCTLTIEKGSRIFFEPSAIFFVAGTLIVNGDSEERVVFTNSRKDFNDVPGQWAGIFFLEGSRDNYIDFAEIRNARIGLRVGTPDADTIPDLVIHNTRIENMSDSGLLCFNSDVTATNTLINNCAVFTVGNLTGGNYRYRHCTFASFNFDFFRNDASTVFADNIVLPDNSLLVNDLDVVMENTLVWGSLNEEVIISESEGINSLVFENNLFRTQLSELEPGENILNTDPEFANPEENDYRLLEGSPAINSGKNLSIPEDLDGLPRDSLPDRGAYEWRP